MSAALPLTVIGGFLGAGKTTLLNRWLREARGMRLAVLVNDFGELNIDAELIAASGGDTIALTNGCVCCQIGDDLSRALIGILEARQTFDAIVVEASGVSDPWRVAQFARADPALSPDGVIVLVDAGTALQHARDSRLADTLVRQLVSADLVVLNKADLASSAERSELRAWIASIAGRVTVFETNQAAVPLAMLTRLASPVATSAAHTDHDCAAHDHDDPAHGELFNTWSCRPDTLFDAVALRAWLNAALAGLLRLKGLIRTGETSWSELQFAGRHGSLRPASAPMGGPALVAIGLRAQLPVQALDALFSSRPSRCPP